jgi:hypothetical protein
MGSVLLAILLAGPAPATGPAKPPAPTESPAPWAALLGSGLLTLNDTATFPKGKFGIALTLDNRDRDPLGLDIVDGGIAWNYGLTPWAETYGRFLFNRSVAVPDTPVLPPPPLDQIVLPGAIVPTRPYYSFYPPTPYVDDTGAIHFGAGTPGDGLVGAKARVLPQKGARPFLAASLEIQFPIARNLRDLQAGAGTGGYDVRVGATFEWLRGPWSFVTSTSFTRVGGPPFPDRRIEWRGGAMVVTDEDLILPHRVDAGVGARRVLQENLAAVAEITTVFDVGHRTRIVDRARPVDVLAGLQFRNRKFRVTAALRDHRNALPSMKERPSPLAGLVDMTRVSASDLAAYLGQAGLSEAVPQLRIGTHRLVVPAPGGPPLPAGARVIPDTYRIRSEHQFGFLLLWAMTF